MADHGQFIWCDLSTFRPDVTQPFYDDLLGWRFFGGDYAIAESGGQPTAALFPMPQKFREIGMPSFWMSYIGVRDVEAAVATAETMGGKVEIGPSSFEGGGRYALIRDPLGAGFTVYEGNALGDGRPVPGGRRTHGLFVSEAARVMPFYEAVFGWTFGREQAGTRQILRDGHPIAHLHDVPDPAVRGKEEYWAILFDAPRGAGAGLDSLGGRRVAEVDLPEGRATLAADPDGGHFFLLEGTAAKAQPAPRNASVPWRAWTGLALIALAVITGWGWISALFFAVWTVMGLRDGVTYLFEPVARRDHPVLYWLTLASFAGLAVLSLVFNAAF